jgi:hypothetical protein
MSDSFEVFTDFVSSFRLSEPTDPSGFSRAEVSDITWMDPNSGVMTAMPAIWFRSDDRLTLKALQAKIQKWLLRLGIATDDKIEGIVTCIIALLSEDGHSLPKSIQLLEQHASEIDVLHWHVLPTKKEDVWQGSMEWDGFAFCRLDAQNLIYRCRKANAINHMTSAGALDGTPAILSPTMKRKILDIGRLFWSLRSLAVQTHGASVLDWYLNHTARLHVSAMWDDLEDAFLIPVALSFPVFNFSTLRSLAGAETWTCYSGIGKNGNQSWIGRGIQLNVVPMPHDLNQVQSLLDNVSKSFQIKEVVDSRLRGLMIQVCRSISRSNSHLWSLRRDESFLFLIIALEQVFSEKENTTKALTRRTAMVVHRALRLTFKEAEKLASRLYDRRCKLVHQGELGVTTDDLLSTRDFANETLRCLVQICARQNSQDPDFHSIWLRKLDYLIAGIDANCPPSETGLFDAGILGPAQQ